MSSTPRGLHYAAAAKKSVWNHQTARLSIPCLPCKHVIHQAKVQLSEAAWYPVYFLISAISCKCTSKRFWVKIAHIEDKMEGSKLEDSQIIFSVRIAYIYVIYRAGGPYGKKLCPRSWVQPEAAGRGPYSRPRAQFFPIWTDLAR